MLRAKSCKKILSFDEVDAPTILRTNQSVEQMVDAVSNLETILKGKLDLFFE